MRLRSLWFINVLLLLGTAFVLYMIYLGPLMTFIVSRALKANKQQIIVSLTTTPNRINKIKNTLDSILSQSIKADKIYLNIPYVFKRDDTAYTIPKWLEDYPGIIINRSQDFGPITKLLPVLTQELTANAIIITVDDDVWYPRQVLRDLVYYSMQHADVAVTIRNLRLHLDTNPYFDNIEEYYQDGLASPLVIGSSAVVYRRNFFDEQFFDLHQNLPAVCYLADDLVISMYFAQKNISIKQTIARTLNPLLAQYTFKNLPYMQDLGSISYGDGDMLGNQKNYAACLDSLGQSRYSIYKQAFLNKSAHLDRITKPGPWDWFIAHFYSS